eukprot:NODE_6091_length_607_cov_26.500000_g5686_i0.p1 GENE.NODE_6091_length_607_cov_26.500000_g5686_i0~~NODE_6091_length_607_cov_26.500000_g5686_i0.p1  ORF type:complete len:176 (+),score=28.25 NODE_6091_length_607_cov_26.500000_g5686_i0:47-529(+)
MKVICTNLGKEIGYFGPVFYNNLLSLPFLFVAALPQMRDFIERASDPPPSTWLYFTLLMLVGSVMTFCTFWCMNHTSPTTYSVIGGLNKIPVTLLGIIIFSQKPTEMGTLGIATAVTGGLLYAYGNSRSKQLMEIAATRGGGSPSSLSGVSGPDVKQQSV